MWYNRRIVKISWPQSEKVWQDKIKIWTQITKRRIQTIGHVLRENRLLKTVIEGKVDDKNPRNNK